ncbi:SpaA isopeptide-forming pilin-related protein, partial [Macrococcus capreoli]|uniref:SpaA isopeptide-forming pilin-related protein n=1 Tax=Macrococcus capreoli TaxID=2982690 RepID=UPI003EE6EE72
TGIPSSKVMLLDSNGNPVKDSNGNDMVATTDESGKYFFDISKEGDYKVKFDFDKNEYQATKELSTYNNINASVMNQDGMTSSVKLDSNNIVGFISGGINKYKGSVTVKKVDSNDSTKLLAGAEFKIVQGDKVIKEGLVTDANGTVNVNDLPFGDYELVETKAPEKYELSTTPTKFTINSDNTTINLTVKNEISNKGSIQIQKHDGYYRNLLSGAVFEIREKATDQLVDTVTTNSSGRAYSNKVVIGTPYYYEEVKAPEGYKLYPNKVDFTIDETSTIDGRSMDVYVDNYKAFERTISLVKRDGSTNELLDGATFKVERKNFPYDPEITPIFVTEGNVTNGKLTFKVTEPGEYVVTEVKAPDGYVKLVEPIKFLVNYTGSVEYEGKFYTHESTAEIFIDIYNEKITDIDLHKISATDKQSLAGASFSVKKLCEQPIRPMPKLLSMAEAPLPTIACLPGTDVMVVNEVTTGNDGLAHLSLPGDGIYEVRETKAPQGYK